MCQEGERPHDLCILVSGILEIFKGGQKIGEISESGSVIGEISFLLHTLRTATVKAREESKVLLIPHNMIHEFLARFPEVSVEIPRSLARRVDEVSKVLFGMKELSDQLPEALIITDKEGNILAWNKQAEELYGRSWNDMYHKPAEQIYRNKEEFKNFLNEVLLTNPLKRKVMEVVHPEKGIRYVLTSTNILYDGAHNFEGILFLSRDITDTVDLEKKIRRLWMWFIPAIMLAGALVGAFFFIGPQIPGHRRPSKDISQLQATISKDRYLLNLILANLLKNGREKEIGAAIRDFFEMNPSAADLYTGIIVLDKEKKVIGYEKSRKKQLIGVKVGTSYGAISFEKVANSSHYVLVVFRPVSGYPMGKKEIELAFEILRNNKQYGWLLFQMDMDFLTRKYRIGEKELRMMQFNSIGG